ncbi:uncharacterized protein EV422DRAFT_93332 [Fimicolochytrium jonesii]|uniref:uncharacterized protein n=1 Tax=Fimicolochytrium jonesii TaxID=1396493 RepID=UPI0022FEAC73|nr:uncharacterized protein EV422DRAFT_93332 [Fimicolochytrium jonesii]KAI8819956.1 hypothetical protein EV422DRAFT_93332 [Fimicolochytrium jonesii]
MPAEMPSVESPEIVPKPGIFVRAVSPPKSAASGLTEEARTLQQPESQQPESLSLEDEHEYLLKRKREEAGEQSALQFRIDQLQARSTALTRAIRQHKQETREADEKAKVLTNWFANTGKVAFDKEKDRTAALMVRVRKLMEELEQEQNKLQAKIAAEEPNRLRLEVERNGYVESIRKLTGKEATLNEELVILQAELEKQENILEDKKALRDKRILEHMEELDAARKRDLELLLDSLRRQVGPSRESTTDHLQDLVMLDLTGNGLERIPNVTQAPKIRRVVLDHNDIADVKDLKPLKELKFLSLQDNKCSNLDIAWFTDLRVLDAAKNRLTEIQIGQNDEINRLRMLIYVDLSDNRLSNPSLSLSHSKLLQHLNLSNNCFMDFPEVPNDLLCELVISGNSIRALSLKQWSPALRVLEAASNNIQSCDPVAIAMCPFLREIDLSNNLITDFPSLYALAVCRDLEILTLDGTPIIRTMNFNRAVAALFPKLKMLNGKPISGIAREMGRTKIAAYPSGHAIKWCRLAVDYLYAFLMDEHRKEESIRSLGDWKAMEQAHERNIANSLGPRYRPYLRYLYSKQSESDTTTDAEVQEQRVDWLAALLQQNASEFDRMKKSREPSSDLALAGCIDDLEYQIKLHSIIVTQAMWRGRRERRRKLKKSGASRMLQKWWKLCLAQKEEAARKNQAAGAIQKVWKEYSRKKRSKPRSLYHPSPVDRVSRARTPVPATAPAPAQQPPPPKMTVEPSGISVEDTEDDDLENDAAIEEWLDDLDQARETFLGKDTEDYHFEEKPQPVPSVRRADSKEESFLKQQVRI